MRERAEERDWGPMRKDKCSGSAHIHHTNGLFCPLRSFVTLYLTLPVRKAGIQVLPRQNVNCD